MSEFKIGDRVFYNDDDDADVGTIVKAYEDDWYDDFPRWWVKWDSDAATLHAKEDDLVLVQSEKSDVICNKDLEIELLKKRIKELEDFHDQLSDNKKIKSANGVTGHMLYNNILNTHFFRVYNEDHSFTDYNIHHTDLVVTICDEDAFLYEIGGVNRIDHSPDTLGIDCE